MIMKELVQKIEENIDHLNTLVFILNNGMKKVPSYEEQTVKTNIDIYSDCGDRIKATMNEIVEKYGDVKLKDL